ncbi:MAG TPA: circularly permuted type 2 ATP-grasp protein [Xanthobacteraceae bacterium]|nr:circularly permuted type 2 ATP-grasp protein [Xanthobacteraceae bacterium]
MASQVETQIQSQIQNSLEPNNAGLESLVAGYRPLPGVFDEMMAADGRVRAHWQPFLTMLAALGNDEINRRFAAADRYLRDSGVFYRVYEDAAGIERPWPLSHVPLIIEPNEWRQLVAGLTQRAQLLEAVLADCYGPGTLTRDGRLPAAVVAGNPEFLRPLVGVAPPGGAHLRFYAVDVGRGADGRWWVLGDRTQAPSGAGYAIENRLALSRAIPDIYRTTQVERVASFFQALQAEIFSLNRRDDARACLLTPGPMNETYFEHAYLARYLGLLLVEGEDLSVEDDGVFIRTVSGLRRTEVLLRRIDADFADPLELNAASRLGAPGLLQAVRDGKITIINSLGAGLIEARAMLAFLPALAPVVLGAELKMPNVATWWLGSAAMREQMLGRLDTMVIAPAFTEHFDDPNLGGAILGAKLGAKLDTAQREALLQSIRDRGVDYVAQEAVTLSSMPVWRDGKLQPRPFTLRLYIAKTGDRPGDGWHVMPGGFVRIADNIDARAVSLQQGAATADAWMLARGPVAPTTLLPTPEAMPVQRASGLLPSRAADNLFWVGRYVERAEATLRLIRAIVNRVADSAAAPVIGRATSLLVAWSAAPNDMFQAPATFTALAALTRTDLDGSLPRLCGAARAAASVIRDRFSPDAWRAIRDLADMTSSPLAAGPAESAIAERVEAALRLISAFSGLAQENMTQLAGWRFLELGRRIERAVLTCRLTRCFAEPSAPDGSLDLLLELADSQISYRQRYVMIAALAPVIDLVMLDPNNPRSVEFQLERIEAHLNALPKQSAEGRLSPAQQIAAGITTRLRTINASEVGDHLIIDIENLLMKLSDAISSAFLTNNERTELMWEALA